MCEAMAKTCGKCSRDLVEELEYLKGFIRFIIAFAATAAFVKQTG